MEAGLAAVTEEEGVRVTAANVNGFTLAELRFPPGYVQAEREPELPYLALVLDGAMEKTFPSRTMCLERACALTMPVGAVHSARFGPKGARILIVKLRDGSSPLAAVLDRLDEIRRPGLMWLAWRLAGELRASDSAAPLAAEGLALELLASASRETSTTPARRRPPAWLRSAEELVRARNDEFVGLGELAAEIGVHPAHLARTFRAHLGASVGEYGRRLRLEWAATELASSDLPLAMVAARAGFSDQSHFTRAFKRHAGITPARYRQATRPVRRPEA
jgi:AraC family transcriptional regulator